MPGAKDANIREEPSVLELSGFLAGNRVGLECLLLVERGKLRLEGVHLTWVMLEKL